MDEMDYALLIDRLDSVLFNIMLNSTQTSSPAYLSKFNKDKLIETLNLLFNDIRCKDVLITNNTDKLFFGIIVDPQLFPSTVCRILLDDNTDPINYTDYKLEIDSRVFDCELTPRELSALLIGEICSIMLEPTVLEDFKSIVGLYLMSTNRDLDIRSSVSYLVTFAMKDTLRKIGSLYLRSNCPDEVNNYGLLRDVTATKMEQLSLDEPLLIALDKINSNLSDSIRGVIDPKVIILQWVFTVYSDTYTNYNLILDTLKEAKESTGSVLIKNTIDSAINNINSGVAKEPCAESCSINDFFVKNHVSVLNEVSLFKSLKSRGLRAVEDTLYELTVRIKNCSTEEDAMYILRMINSRVGLLEDYIYNTPDLSEMELAHWQEVLAEYRILREELAKKKIWDKKKYGIFIDYNALDQVYGGDNI